MQELTPAEVEELAGLRAANEGEIAVLTAKGINLVGLDETKTLGLLLAVVREAFPGAELTWERQLATLIPKWQAQARGAFLGANGGQVLGRG